jgi:zinc protease
MSTRLLFSVGLGLALFIGPLAARQKPPAKLSVPYTKFTLPNGLTVILHEDHSVPQIAVNVWYHVGSSREKAGRTGFAHLFEHLMFEGSGHVKEGEFDTLLESAGGSNNGSTTEDRTNYFETVPSNALDLALFLESDRMGYLLDVLTPDHINGQREVVKNERRQSYENRPYGMAQVRMTELLYPPTHPYHWPVIGYMDDLNAATADDVIEFFKKYYAPSNASLVVAGDINPTVARQRVEYWFRDVRGAAPGATVPPLTVTQPVLPGVIKETLTDAVQLPRIYLCWLTPALYAPGDADLDALSSVLTDGKKSRLYERLVYDLQVAQDVEARQNSSRLGSIYTIQVTARPSTDPPAVVLARLTGIVDEELDKLRKAPPAPRELERVKNGYEAGFYEELEQIDRKADMLNNYFTATGNPDYFAEDLGRYQKLTPEDVSAAVRKWLPADKRLELSVVPGQK